MTGTKQPEVICPTVDVEISAYRIEQYARAVGDENVRFRREGRDDGGMVAPPTFAAAYLQEPVRAFVNDSDQLDRLGIDRSRIVFGEVEYNYHSLLRPGTWVRCSGHLAERRSSGDKEILVFETRASLDNGDLVSDGRITLVCR